MEKNGIAGWLCSGVCLFLMQGISQTGSFAWLRAFGPLQCVNQEWLLSGFRAVRIFDWPADYFVVWSVIYGIVFLGMVWFVFGRRLPSAEPPRLGGERRSVRGYRVKRGQRLFWWEGRKSLWLEGNIFYLLLTCAVVLCFYRPPQEWVTEQDAYEYREIMWTLKGTFTAEKEASVRRQIQTLTSLQKDVENHGTQYSAAAMQAAQSELERLPVLQKVSSYLSYLSGEGASNILYEKGYLLLLGEDIPGGYLRLCSGLGVALMVLASAALWGTDAWSGMEMLCKSGRKGFRAVQKRKFWWNLCYAGMLGILVYVPWIVACSKTYPLEGWDASANSLRQFAGWENLTVGEIILGSYFLRILYLALVGGMTGLVQRKVQSKSLTVYVSLILGLVPVIL